MIDSGSEGIRGMQQGAGGKPQGLRLPLTLVLRFLAVRALPLGSLGMSSNLVSACCAAASACCNMCMLRPCTARPICTSQPTSSAYLQCTVSYDHPVTFSWQLVPIPSRSTSSSVAVSKQRHCPVQRNRQMAAPAAAAMYTVGLQADTYAASELRRVRSKVCGMPATRQGNSLGLHAQTLMRHHSCTGEAAFTIGLSARRY